MNRRDFLKTAAVFIAGLLLWERPKKKVPESMPEPFYFDLTLPPVFSKPRMAIRTHLDDPFNLAGLITQDQL